jgi:hypothetical protein
MRMPTTMTVYTYAAIAAPLTQALTEVIERQVAARGPTLDETIAEMLVRALAANGAEGAHHRVQGRAQVWVWRVQEGEQSPYVAAVEGPDLRVCTFLPDAQPATLEALVERLCPRDDHA